MEQKVYVLDGRQFRTESDYACAKRDKELIDRLRSETDFGSMEELKALRGELRGGKYRFRTLLGRDFQDEVDQLLRKAEIRDAEARKSKKGKGKTNSAGKARGGHARNDAKGKSGVQKGTDTARRNDRNRPSERGAESGNAACSVSEEDVQKALKMRERRRKLIMAVCCAAALCCLGYFSVYSYYIWRTENTYRKLSELKEKSAAASSPTPAVPAPSTGPLYTLNGEPEQKEVLEEYKNLLLKNRKLIGWVTVEGTVIDYPVMQTTDNEYYLDHNMEQERDSNGTIFMDKDCDVLKPSTNFILYGHHMKSGKMFGQLDRYQNESFYKEHPYISFDTIYEKGTYQVMYVFRSRVYAETEITFKYYQFIEANGKQEFDSNMQEMAAMSLYDTGVTAEYGDQLLTLSTCDYRETDGRFVVVAKKISE